LTPANAVTPAAAMATEGSLLAMASSRTLPKVPVAEGNAKMSADA
jgi:hypothetical protein